MPYDLRYRLRLLRDHHDMEASDTAAPSQPTGNRSSGAAGIGWFSLGVLIDAAGIVVLSALVGAVMEPVTGWSVAVYALVGAALIDGPVLVVGALVLAVSGARPRRANCVRVGGMAAAAVWVIAIFTAPVFVGLAVVSVVPVLLIARRF